MRHIELSLDILPYGRYTLYMAILTKPEGFDEYSMALLYYKRACSVYKKIKLRLSGRTDEVSEFQLYKAEKAFSQECKAYYVARREYSEKSAIAQLKDKGVDVSVLEFARLAGCSVPLTMREITEQARKQALGASMNMSAEELAKFKQEVEELRAARKPQAYSKSEVLSSVLDDNSYGDFAPLELPEDDPANVPELG